MKTLTPRSIAIAAVLFTACVGDSPTATTDGGTETCGGGTCVEVPPVGWTGPVAVYLGNPASAPSCAGDYPQEKLTANADLVAAPATCAACTCQPPANPACGAATVTAKYTPGDCTNGTPTSTKTITAAPNACVQYVPDSSSVQLVTGVAVTGTASPCVPFPQTPQATVTPPKWNAKAVACGATSLVPNGCSGGKVCAATPPPPLSSKLCVYKTGDAACPAGAYAQKTVVFAGALSDTRGCGNCSCGTPAVDCAGMLTVYTHPDNSVASTCTDPVVATTAAPTGTCKVAGSANQTYALKYVPTAAPPPATCPPQGGQPTGAATAADPTTICCTP